VQWTGDQFGLQGLFDMGGGHLPPYLGRWTGDQFGLQGLFDMGGGHLPPYLCSGLVLNLTCKTCSMSVVDIYHHICEVDWWSICLVQSTALEQDLFDMGGGHLPPYLGSGLVINLACKACSIWVVDIYHHICDLACKVFDMGGGHLNLVFSPPQFDLQDLFDMGGGHLPPYLGSGLVINLACKACSIWVVDIYHHICAGGLVINLACKACSI
jgi:hypothetical protein